MTNLETKANEIKEETTMTNVTTKTTDELKKEITGFLRAFNYDVTDYGVSKIIGEWLRNKESLIKLFEKHPSYNGNYQIVFDKTEYTREVDYSLLSSSCNKLYSLCRDVFHIGLFADHPIVTIINELTCYGEQFIDTQNHRIVYIKDVLEKEYPKIKLHNGEKTSKFLNKLCTYVGLDKNAEYQKHFAKWSDAINPTKLKRTTVISVNPIDFYAMSFGNSWASCHTIDKENVRCKPDNYAGQYSSGTESYMLDGTSFVVYTISESETEEWGGVTIYPRITRCMFHYGEDKLIQGRMYPQSNDGAATAYRETRELVQKTMAELLEIPNFWVNKKGTGECGAVTRSRGTHYSDYTCFSDCNVSYVKGSENNNLVIIGHDPICPSCGDEHDYEESICCESCWDDCEICAHCGERVDRDEVYWIDGEPYCDNCTVYCDYHGEREVGSYYDMFNITPIGHRWSMCVCEDALDGMECDGDIYRCCECGDIIDGNNDEYVVTEDDGDVFCCANCAERAGYAYCEQEGGWFSNDNEIWDLLEQDDETEIASVTA